MTAARSIRRRTPAWAVGLCSLACALPLAAIAQPRLDTHAERTSFIETGRYPEVAELCTAFAAAYPDAVRCEQYGTSPEGRAMQALVVSRSGVLDPEAARRAGLPVILVQGGIHSGEIEGKDAGFLALRQMLDGQAAPGALDKLVLVFVPLFNVDGHERFARWNRPNQRGPLEMGRRATGQNYNLNRDYIKADSPEMRAMLGLLRTWDPLLVADIHATNGAQFEPDIAVQTEPLHVGDERLLREGKALSGRLLTMLERRGSMPLPFYPTFVRYDDPSSGFAQNVYEPRYSTGYVPLRNRFTVLVETHSWKDYPTRVGITRDFIVGLIEDMATHGKSLRAQALAADARAQSLPGTTIALDWEAEDSPRQIDFRGYAYTRLPSTVSGALVTRYDETTPQIWRVPLRDRMVPSISATVPGQGYLVPAARAADVAGLLDLHGIDYRRLEQAVTGVPVQVFRARKVQLASSSFEGRQRAQVEGAWADEPQTLPQGSLFIPVAQPLARLVVAMFEPLGPDSLLAWGQFNTAFEPKEYMDAYVAEQIAVDMLRDPAVAAEFAARMRDPAFATNPRARLAFFAQRHESWDERENLYPVYRLEQPLPGPAADQR